MDANIPAATRLGQVEVCGNCGTVFWAGQPHTCTPRRATRVVRVVRAACSWCHGHLGYWRAGVWTSCDRCPRPS